MVGVADAVNATLGRRDDVVEGVDGGVAGADGGQGLVQAGPAAGDDAGQSVVKVDPVVVDTEALEDLTLGSEILTVGGAAGVADQGRGHARGVYG
jgi:hypothetical protein